MQNSVVITVNSYTALTLCRQNCLLCVYYLIPSSQQVYGVALLLSLFNTHREWREALATWWVREPPMPSVAPFFLLWGDTVWHRAVGRRLGIWILISALPETAAASAKSLQSCPILWDPIDSSPLSSSVPGILQARTLEWVAIFFSNAWKWKVRVRLLSRARLFATPWIAAHQAPPSMGFSRQDYWSGVPLPSPYLRLLMPIWTSHFLNLKGKLRRFLLL